jgi:hypothetical protein
MSPFLDSPPASAPHQGRPVAERAGTSLRRAAGLSLAGLLVLLLVPAGLATPCAPRAATCPGGECGARDTTACPDCPAMALGARSLHGTNDLTDLTFPGGAGCACEVAPAKAPPARVSAAEGQAERSASRGMLPSQVTGGAPEPGRIAIEGRVPGSPPEPGVPLHLRNRVLRI